MRILKGMGAPMNTNKPKYRLKSKFRFTVFVVIMMLMLVTVSNTILGINNASSLTKPEYASIQIKYGDTLWNLASEYNQDGKDIRKFVYEICELNEISADSIYPGQCILIPVYS